MRALLLFVGYLLCLTVLSMAAWSLPPVNFAAVVAAFTVACVLVSRARS